jgi:hypothetical protein
MRTPPTNSCNPKSITSADYHMGAALQSVVRDDVSSVLGYSIPPRRHRFRYRPRGFPTVSVCRILSYPAHPLVRFAFPPEFTNHRRPGTHVRTPSLGFLPSSRHQKAESTFASFPSSLRSVHDVSHVLDGFLLRLPLRVYFTPQPRPGFALQGLSLAKSRTSSSLAVALMPLPAAPARSLTQWLQNVAPAYRALLLSRIRRNTRRFRPRAARYPPELHPPSGSPSHTVQATFTACSDHGLSRPPSYHQCATKTCSCELASPVRGPRPEAPPRLAPLLCYEATLTESALPPGDRPLNLQSSYRFRFR